MSFCVAFFGDRWYNGEAMEKHDRDYTSVVVHIFLEEARELYAIERLWSDAQKVDVEPYLVKKEEEAK